ncbi:hypothetical protein H4R33_006011 [Dimargaris cristalligena]|nr:hypothetical protein H4R33_006011 [Dimargaris cristalligena]
MNYTISLVLALALATTMVASAATPITHTALAKCVSELLQTEPIVPEEAPVTHFGRPNRL